MKSHQYYVYILLCSDDSYYVGVTNDIERRLKEHNHSENNISYTYSRRPVKLVFQEEFNDINVAISKEKQIKGWTRQKKEALIKGEFRLLPKLSKKKFKE